MVRFSEINNFRIFWISPWKLLYPFRKNFGIFGRKKIKGPLSIVCSSSDTHLLKNIQNHNTHARTQSNVETPPLLLRCKASQWPIPSWADQQILANTDYILYCTRKSHLDWSGREKCFFSFHLSKSLFSRIIRLDFRRFLESGLYSPRRERGPLSRTAAGNQTSRIILTGVKNRPDVFFFLFISQIYVLTSRQAWLIPSNPNVEILLDSLFLSPWAIRLVLVS